MVGYNVIEKDGTHTYEKVGENQIKNISKKIRQKVIVKVIYSAPKFRFDLDQGHVEETSQFEATNCELINIDAFVDANGYLIRYIKLIIDE